MGCAPLSTKAIHKQPWLSILERSHSYRYEAGLQDTGKASQDQRLNVTTLGTVLKQGPPRLCETPGPGTGSRSDIMRSQHLVPLREVGWDQRECGARPRLHSEIGY